MYMWVHYCPKTSVRNVNKKRTRKKQHVVPYVVDVHNVVSVPQ